MTTKIYATYDALGNPTGFHLTPGQAHDLDGADALLPTIIHSIDSFLADKAYDAKERVLNLLDREKVNAFIPNKANRFQKRSYDKEMYKWRHLIENFFQKLKNYRAIATRYDKLLSALADSSLSFPGRCTV